MDKKFGNLKVGDYIARVEGYKVESAKILCKKKRGRDEIVITAKGTETKQNYTFKVLGHHSTMVGFSINGQERYYADGSIVSALRDGIEIGIEYARREVVNSFKTMSPYFTVNGRPAE